MERKLTKFEKTVLLEQLDLNACEALCQMTDITGHFPKYSCEDLNDNGTYKCKWRQAIEDIKKKLSLTD